MPSFETRVMLGWLEWSVMRQTKYLCALATFVIAANLSISPARSQDKRELILSAQKAYYNLPTQGLVEFQCSVTPDWSAMLKREMKTDFKPDNPALKLLNGVHFWVSVTATGKVKMTHEVDSSPVSTSDLDNFQKAIGGIEETTDGFWKAASTFLLTSALPKPESDYQLTEQNDEYLVSYRDGAYEIATRLGKDYSISEIKVTSAKLSSSIKPNFKKTDGGLLLTAYDAEYKLTPGNGAHVFWQLKYLDVEGLHLPAELTSQTSTDAGTHEVLLRFTDYQIKRR